MSPLLLAVYGKYLKYVPSGANCVHAKICTSKIKKWSGMSPLLPAAYGKYLKYVPSRANFVHAKICTFFPAVQGI